LKEISTILSLLDYYFIYNLNRINQELKGDFRISADQLICGYKDYYTLLLAFKHKIQLDSVCKLSSDIVKEAYSASKISELVDILKRSYYSQYLDFSEPYNTLESMYILARINARKRALAMFMGSPFSPLAAFGVLELIRLNIEDLITIVNGIKLEMPAEKIRKFLSIG
ncbi:MAG: V-type ATPase subunit, partial [Sulfolobaceae archaeon]